VPFFDDPRKLILLAVLFCTLAYGAAINFNPDTFLNDINNAISSATSAVTQNEEVKNLLDKGKELFGK